MKLFHICAKKEFDVEGKKMVKWYRAGVLKVSDAGKQYIQLYQNPTIDYYVFESEPFQDDYVGEVQI